MGPRNHKASSVLPYREYSLPFSGTRAEILNAFSVLRTRKHRRTNLLGLPRGTPVRDMGSILRTMLRRSSKLCSFCAENRRFAPFRHRENGNRVFRATKTKSQKTKVVRRSKGHACVRYGVVPENYAVLRSIQGSFGLKAINFVRDRSFCVEIFVATAVYQVCIFFSQLGHIK